MLNLDELNRIDIETYECSDFSELSYSRKEVILTFVFVNGKEVSYQPASSYTPHVWSAT